MLSKKMGLFKIMQRVNRDTVLGPIKRFDNHLFEINPFIEKYIIGDIFGIIIIITLLSLPEWFCSIVL